MPDQFDPTTPSEMDATIALEASQRLARLLENDVAAVQLGIEVGGELSGPITIPHDALRLLRDALSEIAKGNAVTLTKVHTELTTQQAADLLNVSRPFLVALLDDGKIPNRKVGTHRRVRLDDLKRYRDQIENARLKVLEELARQGQELDLGYES